MLTQLLKAGLLLKIGIWLKSRGKGLILTTTGVVFSWVIHSEYLAYVELSGEKNYLALSYVIKWIVAASLIAAYFYFSRNITNKLPSSSKIKYHSTTSSDNQVTPNQDDGFDFLRAKDKLETKADKTIKRG